MVYDFFSIHCMYCVGTAYTKFLPPKKSSLSVKLLLYVLEYLPSLIRSCSVYIIYNTSNKKFLDLVE